uniref:FAD-binding domain-containing protein n=1 Tax=Rhodosorus marinus TaxID=101924 RepID=A0A7S3EFG0_9RHOD|mmetsp:Transcript_28059/g.110333  ORF Transcript_28059/g.110333 Transcript_28059/m.110333 type:complete len:423 (+) Transcript_28059:510-1778(+)|eukprot:CAMPEP_0113957054 /NCGR_PEP_ID=MMETSP0011_2-20120614/2496_1 /TAXON_ID=101924 /ORGANISM="Rhodosorus marinus" /LENGTH=422 /DNA_ID=CAMNT_0000967453 /DNA_START=230 /DNA_END=1498 /DNA_ORIENTATION=+ /assembly_acc=CAM_ASM_000156
MKRFLSTSSGLSTKSFDVVIAGGGLVGASVALGLATDKLAAPLSVAIVDTSLPPAKEEVYDKPTLRTSTISLKSRKWMQGLGAWKDRHATAFGDMFVYDKNQGITFDAKQDELEHLGYVVENEILRNEMYKRLRELGGKEITGATVTEIDAGISEVDYISDPKHASLVLQDGKRLSAQLIVGAEGANSVTRRESEIGYWRHDYRQRAVVANVKTRDHSFTAWQRFLGKSGPVAMLPIKGGSISNVVWSTTPAEAKALTAMSDGEFLKELNLAFEEDWDGRVPPLAVEVVGKRASFPLSVSHATEYVGKRLVLVGDAAHGVHPLAGQGVNLGFADAEELVRCLAVAASTGRAIGLDEALLLKYQGRRMPENLFMTGVLHSIKSVYEWDDPALESLRSFGVKMVDSMPLVKRAIVKYQTLGDLR